MARMKAGDLTPEQHGALITTTADDGTALTMFLNSLRVEYGQIVLAGWCVDRNVEVMLVPGEVVHVLHPAEPDGTATIVRTSAGEVQWVAR